METICKTYDTRRKRRLVEPTLKSRVDWKRTKRDDLSHLLDSDESETSEEEELEESCEESDDDSAIDDSEDQSQDSALSEEDGQEGRIRKPRVWRKSATIDSESSSDSDGPGERINTKRSCVIHDDDSDEEAAKEPPEDEATKAQKKKQKRLEALNQLSERQRSRKRTTSTETPEEIPHDECEPSLTISESEDSDEMSDFIVPDKGNNEGARNEGLSYKQLFRKHNISLSAGHDLSSHLENVIKAFLNDIIKKKFLALLYNGSNRKKSAVDMLQSLNNLDQRIIAPRLEKLTTSCRWSKRYKERIDSYPNLFVKHIAAEEMVCKACDLKRYCGYLVILSGQAYHHETLEHDDFLQNDRQRLIIGKTCAMRTEAYHQLRHYKYFLYQRCIPFTDQTRGGSTCKRVKKALSKMEAQGFLGREMEFLEGYLNEADYFEEEAKDSLFG
ncbi:coiled-coil domain-containing protein 82 [Engystomops pustulosus]|uniref:coiled-coil domain-containing protein 82 n=1 Tax=Engystomops pustulosus TaxID=76066 RepID=UPI003AFB42C0